MNFNFSNLNNSNFTSTAGQYLRPYNIYTVNLTKIEKSELNGKDGKTVYPIIELEFTGVGDAKGVFTTNLFIPTSEKDMERRVSTNANGHESPRPSSFENFQYTLMQIVEVLNPSGAEKIKQNGDKIKTIDQFIERLVRGKLEDGQLSDSPLSLRDIDEICEAFSDILKGVYHERIEYPNVRHYVNNVPAVSDADVKSTSSTSSSADSAEDGSRGQSAASVLKPENPVQESHSEEHSGED
jgi:hypothetical protein